MQNLKGKSEPAHLLQQTESEIDFAKLYDEHAEYSARRKNGSIEQQQIEIEVSQFKLPNLTKLLPQDFLPQRVIEIGCATGELIANFPVSSVGERVGVDISPANIATAKVRFPSVFFHAGNFTDFANQSYDCVILSDILEHVEDDAKFLADASKLGKYVLVNLPLEDNWLNRNRNYGPDDTSGHLRKYSLDQGLDLFKRAGLKILDYQQVWIHETAADQSRHQLKIRYSGSEYSGPKTIRVLKSIVMVICKKIPSIGHRLFASNLFAIAQKDYVK